MEDKSEEFNLACGYVDVRVHVRPQWRIRLGWGEYDDQSWKVVFELLNTVDAALFGRVTYKDLRIIGSANDEGVMSVP